MTRLAPLRFRPTLRRKVWGTRDLRPLLAATEGRIGEAWCLHDGSRVWGGDLDGSCLAALVRRFGRRLMGAQWRRSAGYGAPRDAPRGGTFPIVGKLLFGAGRLSIQVHPDNPTALRLEGGLGKTELWHVLDAAPGALLGLGTRGPVEAEALARAALDGSIEDLMRWVPARRGQCVLVQAGTVHSIRGGVVLCEIQQNSDLTYRLFDHRQSGLDGKPRALQVDKAVAAADTRLQPQVRALARRRSKPCRIDRIGGCPYFEAELLSWTGPFLYTPDPRRCEMLLMVRGCGTVDATEFETGDAFLVPSEAARFPVDGLQAQAVRSYLP